MLQTRGSSLEKGGQQLQFGVLFRRFRRRRFSTQQALAESSSFSLSYINLLERGKRVPSLPTIKELTRVLELTEQEGEELIAAARSDRNITSTSKLIPHAEEWGEAPRVRELLGREQELAVLERWIVGDRCHVVAVLGLGGMGKTALATKLAEQVSNKFNYIFWYSLLNAPPLENFLRPAIRFLSNQAQIDVPTDLDNQISLFIRYLQDYKCLVVLDNIDAILQSGNPAGQYQNGYEAYGRLIERVEEAAHQSCLLLTSREKLREVARLEGQVSLLRSMQLTGLSPTEGQEILQGKGLFGSDESWESLIKLYSGNPLALNIISEPIREVFGGDISAFLKEEKAVFGDLYQILDHQFRRLSSLEQAIMYWLAIEREVITLDELQGDMSHIVPKHNLLEALNSLRRRYMIESSGTMSLTLQPVIMEYITHLLIEQICAEIDAEEIELFAHHALIKAQAKDYVRDSQNRVILRPLVERLLITIGKEGLEGKVKRILSDLRKAHRQKQGYTAGNALNLLIQIKADLGSYDFSHLEIWQAYLRGVELHDVNFTYSNFSMATFTEVFSTVLSVAFSQGGEFLAAGTANGEVRVWRTSSATPLLSCQGHADWVYSVAFGPQSEILVTGSGDRTVRLWEVSTGQCLKTLLGHSDAVRSVTFSTEGSILATGSEDQTVRLWEVNTGLCRNTLQGHTNPVWSVAFSPEGTIIASGNDDQTVRLWEVTTQRLLHTLQGHTIRIRAVAFSPDGSLLATGSEDRTVRLWEVKTGHLLNILRGHTNPVWSVAFSPDGKSIATGSDDQTVRLWEVSTGNLLNTLTGHTNQVWAIALHPDGKIVATGNEDCAVRLWEVKTGHLLNTLLGHTSRVRSVAFSPNGTMLATGSEDRTVRLWEVKTGHLLNTLQGHASWIWSVAFSPDAKSIASGSEDGSIGIWETQTGKCITALRSDRLYERMDITGVKGLTEGQKVVLRALGATEK